MKKLYQPSLLWAVGSGIATGLAIHEGIRGHLFFVALYTFMAISYALFSRSAMKEQRKEDKK